MNWQIGDRAIYDCPGSRVHGYKVTITSNLIMCRYIVQPDGLGHTFTCGIPVPAEFANWSNYPEHFKPIPDGDTSTWQSIEELCGWSPLREMV